MTPSNWSGLDPTELDDDTDAGAKIHQRAARMAVLNVPVLRELAPDLVVSDVITAWGGLAAELLAMPWIELNPHPLYRPSKGLLPLGSGLAPGGGIRGRLRDAVMRALTARSWRRACASARRCVSRSACRQPIPARCGGSSQRCPPWRCRGRTGLHEAVLVGPLHFEPTSAVLEIPPGTGPVVIVAPSTAMTGTLGLTELALESLKPGGRCPRLAGGGVAAERARWRGPPWAVVGLGRQDELLSHADLVICGGGHGMVSKTPWPGCRWWWCRVAAINGRSPIVLCAKAVRSWSGR